MERIRRIFNSLKGQMVISGTVVYRLIGIMDDGEDYYYALYNGREIEYHSCVMSVVPLKGFIREKDYQEMVRIAKLNHFDQPDLYLNDDPEGIKVFNEKHKQSLLSKLGENSFLIEGPCWDLN